jgi:hypothetical protein
LGKTGFNVTNFSPKKEYQDMLSSALPNEFNLKLKVDREFKGHKYVKTEEDDEWVAVGGPPWAVFRGSKNRKDGLQPTRWNYQCQQIFLRWYNPSVRLYIC